MNRESVINKQYVNLILWLLKDSVLRLKKSVILVLVLSKISVLTQAATFILIILYIRKLSVGEHSISILEEHTIFLPPQSSNYYIYIVAVVFFTLVVLSEIGIYVSRRNTLNLDRRYNEICSRRVIENVSSAKIFSKNVIQQSLLQKNILLRTGLKDSRCCGIVLRKLLDSIIPLLTVFLAFGILIYLNWKLTLLVLFFLCAYIALQASVSRKAAHYAATCEQISPIARRKFAEWIQYYQYAPLPAPLSSSALDDLYHKGPLKTSLDAYIGRILTISESRLVTGLFSGLVFSLVFVFLAAPKSDSSINWGVVLTYLIALRFALINLKSLFVQVTTINRMYPSVSRYFSFIRSFGKSVDPDGPLPNQFDIKVNGSIFAQSEKRVHLEPGSCMALITSYPLDRYTMGMVLSSLFGMGTPEWDNAIRSVQFVSTKSNCPEKTLRALFKLPCDADWDSIAFPKNLLDRIRSGLSDDLDSVIGTDRWNDSRPESRFGISLIHASTTGCKMMLVEGRGLRLLHNYFNDIRPLFDRNICIITHGIEGCRVGDYGETTIAVINGKECVGAGNLSWFESNKLFIKRYLHQGHAPLEDADDDEMDDEEVE
jgi:ABC-type multidrug transport system fused ATPase/permease subunit